jgi:hypothetical protein
MELKFKLNCDNILLTQFIFLTENKIEKQISNKNKIKKQILMQNILIH